VRGPSDPQETSGDVRTQEQCPPGTPPSQRTSADGPAAPDDRPLADTPTLPPGTPPSPAAAEATIADDVPALPADTIGSSRGIKSADAPAAPGDRPLADTPTRGFLDVVSSFKNTINTCVLAIVFSGCLAYFAEHVHAGLVVNIAKGGFVVSITTAGTVTIAVAAGLVRGVAGTPRRRRKKKKQNDDGGDGPTIEYRGLIGFAELGALS
jgi:hypothetical protein